MPQAPLRHVFVYGTLRRGACNDITRLDPAPVYVGMGEVKGTLYSLGGYLGLSLGGAATATVVGEVYEIAPRLERLLDRIEQIVPGDASEYFKRELAVEVAGRPLRCLVYEINPKRVLGLAPLGHGDWTLFRST